jgi:hypothetical protein
MNAARPDAGRPQVKVLGFVMTGRHSLARDLITLYFDRMLPIQSWMAGIIFEKCFASYEYTCFAS